MTKFIIYGLRDPRTNHIRYVGQSRQGLKRPKAHWMPSNLRKGHHIHRWLETLLKENLMPDIVVLEELDGPEQLNHHEMFWIAKLRYSGRDLTNATEGGDAALRIRQFSAETRAKMRQSALGRKASPEARKNISDAHKGLTWKVADTTHLTGKNNPSARRVRCLNDGREFDTVNDASAAYGVSRGFVTKECQKRPRFRNRNPLRFEYI